jgi:hypothetical protein
MQIRIFLRVFQIFFTIIRVQSIIHLPKDIPINVIKKFFLPRVAKLKS